MNERSVAFEKAITRLEEIVKQMEQGNLPLDAALRPFNAPRPRRDDYGAYARAASSVKERHGVPSSCLMWLL